MKHLFYLLQFFVLLYTNSYAVTFTTTSAGNWSNNGNWTPGSPGFNIQAGDTVLVNHSMNLNGNLDISGVVIVNNLPAKIGGPKDIDIDFGGELHNMGEIDIQPKDLHVDGSLFNSGYFKVAEVHNDGYVCNSGTLELSKDFDNHGGTIECGGFLLTCELKIHNNNGLGLTALVHDQDICCQTGPGNLDVDHQEGVFDSTTVSFCGQMVLHQKAMNLFAEVSEIGQVNLDFKVVGFESIAGYHIEKSANGGSFEEIAYLNGSEGISDYAWIDDTPGKGETAYRVRAINDDGMVINSNIALVNFEGSSFTMQAYPNPSSSGQFSISLSEMPSDQSKLKVYDISGRMVYEETFSNTNAIQPDVTLGSGIYILTIESGKTRESARLVVRAGM